MYGRTLPSSPPLEMEFLDESIDNAPLLRIDETAEEDESTMGSPSTNHSGQPQNNGTSSLQESSFSSANTSDNDDDVVIGLLIPEANKQTDNSRVKGKGVVRLRIDENERENVS